MRKFILILILIVPVISTIGQNKEKLTENVFRFNLINPALEYEMALTNKSVLSTAAGVGLGVYYKNLVVNETGLLFSPFIDIEYKNIYNLEKRNKKDKNINCNSGNYFGIRLLSRFKEIESAYERTDDIDFSLNPVWGIQRKLGTMHILFDAGPMFYFDTKGNCGIGALKVQLNIGFNLKKRKE